MRFNATEIIEFAVKEGDQEGRMTYKPPSKSIYESGYKERWFKLRGNLLFYYRLNEQGAVEKNEPNGVFILENISIEKEVEDMKYLYGFSITWKDESFRKHCFFTLSENLLHNWISKLIRASYENLRAELLVLRLQIQRKSGKDPLEHLGTPLPVRSIRGVLASPSKATSYRSPLGIAPSSSETTLAPWPKGNGSEFRSDVIAAKSAPNTPSVTTKFDSIISPLPPPRTNRARRKLSGKEAKYSVKNVGPNESSFKSHIVPYDTDTSASFRSHIKLSEEELQEFLN